MLCPYCAEEINDVAIKCKHCGSMISQSTTHLPSGSRIHNIGEGTNVQVTQNVTTHASLVGGTPTAGLALWCFGLALGGLFTTWFIPVLVQLISILCGHLAISQIKKSNGAIQGTGYAVIGLVISYTMLAIGFFVILAFGSAIAWLLSLGSHH